MNSSQGQKNSGVFGSRQGQNPPFLTSPALTVSTIFASGFGVTFADAKVTLNPDPKLAEAVKAGLVRKNGFCPCRLPKNPEFFCPCDEFKAQMRDPSCHGLCHCRLYLKP